MKLPSPSMGVALAALVVAATGSAHAAGLIGSAEVRNGSLTGKDIKNGSLAGKELKKGTVQADRLSAKARAALSGQTGPAGPQGPSDVYVTGDSSLPGSTPASLSQAIPAGDYLILGTVLASGGSNVAAGCRIHLDDQEIAASFGFDTAGGDQTLNLQTIQTLASPGTLTMVCVGGSTFGNAEIAAIKVGTLH
jgi:hypothetical protein